MANRGLPRTLILATSWAPELRPPALRSRDYPRTDYVELARLLDCDILDYWMYDGLRSLASVRALEKNLRLDLYLALSGFRRARKYDVVVLMSERVAIPYGMLGGCFGRRAEAVFLSMHSSSRQARVFRRLGISGTDQQGGEPHSGSGGVPHVGRGHPC